MNAEVVGINSFISTPSGASAGVGFSVPAHIFTRVYNQILQTGKVSRGYAGVSMNRFPLTPAMAKYFGVKQGVGVLITQLSDENGTAAESGPAAKAGLKPEDVVVEFDGKPVKTTQDFRLAVANTPPGQKTKIKVVRHGEEKELDIVLAERIFPNQKPQTRYSFDEKQEKPKTEIGLEINNIPPRIARDLELTGGAYVLTVKPGSLADDAGLVAEADVIVSVNGKPVANAQELNALVKGLKSGESMVLKIVRSGRDENNRLQMEICYTSLIKP
jgi:serine protease Do